MGGARDSLPLFVQLCVRPWGARGTPFFPLLAALSSQAGILCERRRSWLV